MGLPYKILLYNNGKRVNVLDRVDNYSNAVKIYNQIVKDNKCYFPKNYNWLGALVKVIPKGNFVIKKITPYCIEETFKHKNTDTKHTFRTLVKNFLVNNTNTRVILSINNKLVIQYFENDDLDVFVLKNREDSQRLNETIREFSYANGLTNFIFFNDPTIDTIRPIYDSLEANYGISREWMSRVSTR
jgi:L-cysteine desulfidase